MEAHCVNLELKYQNQALKEGQHGQFSKVKSIEAKVKHDIDVIETINIELEHKVAKLLKENETLKKHYKELYDSIKTTRARNIEHTTSLIAKNDDFKAQLQEKGFAIAALKNELRKLTRNSVNTKFAKSSILGKPVLQPHRNQSVVRQPTAFKSEQPKISKPWFAPQVDINKNLSKLVTTHYLPKRKESACAKPHHMIAPSSSRSESTANGSKSKLRINNKNSRTWPASKIGLKWVPTGKIFTSSTTRVDSEPTNGSNDDITNQYECEQTLDVSAGTLNLSAGTSFNPKKEGLRVCSELGIHDHSNEPSSSKLVLKVIPPADKTATSRQELELLFHHHITLLRILEIVKAKVERKSRVLYKLRKNLVMKQVRASVCDDEEERQAALEGVNNEDIEYEDVEIEIDDDAELIFPYEVKFDKTPPPGNVSSDFVSSDSVSFDYESEHVKVNVAPEATIGTLTQDLNAHSYLSNKSIRDGELEVKWFSCRAEIALLKSNNKVEGIREWGECHVEKKLVERFYMEMVRIEAVSKPPSDDEDTERPRKKSKKSSSD
ncbi:hypothetical protein Tco_0001988 [Tanacetum coccineum]